MTSPVFSDALTLFDNTINTSVSDAESSVDTAAPGAVQSGIDYDSLVSALLNFGQVGADVGDVFAQMFEAVINEALTAGILATSIATDILRAINKSLPPEGAAVAFAAAEDTGTVSSVLAQVQQEITTTAALLETVKQNADDQTPANIPAGLETQVLGGQILFQQDVDAVINSFPSPVSDSNESNAFLIATLQNLLLTEQNLSNILNEIDTNNNLEQPISLTGLNVLLVLADAVILTDVAVAAASYAGFALEVLTGELFTVSAVGPYTVDVPAGATFVDIVLIGGGGGGGGYNTAGSGTGGNGGDTTATPSGGSTLTAAGGAGGASATGTAATATAGGSPGTESFDGQTYVGGSGGTVGASSAGGNGAAPGAGGGGGANGSYGGAGGAAGVWAAQTIAITEDITTISGSVGASGTSGAASNASIGGTGGHGSAYFYFYT